jgi:hypothetical protein
MTSADLLATLRNSQAFSGLRSRSEVTYDERVQLGLVTNSEGMT